MCNEELYYIYAAPNITVFKSRRIRWAKHVARMEQMKNEHNILAGKPEGMRPLGRSRHRREDKIRMHLMV
jgi:hypothetical protein